MGAPGRPGSRSWIPLRLLRYAGFSVGLPARWLDWFLRLELLLRTKFQQEHTAMAALAASISGELGHGVHIRLHLCFSV